MNTAIVRLGARSSSESVDSGYGWAVPSYTYNASQYAPGPMPAPAWPKSSYSGFLTDSSVMTIPNWAMILGGGVLYHTLTSGKKIPVRSNPYGFVFLPILIGTGVLAAGFGTYKAMDAFHGYSGAGLYLGLALGGIYGLKNKQKGAIAAGALIGWALGTAYEKAV